MVSVTGFDDLIWSPVVTPALTTVRMDMATIADLAIAALMRAIESEGEPENDDEEVPAGGVTSEIDRVPMQLIVRQSTGAANLHANSDAKTQNKPTAGELKS